LINPENLENPESDIELFDYNLEELYYFYYFYFKIYAPCKHKVGLICHRRACVTHQKKRLFMPINYSMTSDA
jgi:hypothetical protein